MKFGLSDSQFKILLDLVIRPLQNQGAKVFIFGSRVKGNHHPFQTLICFFKKTLTNQYNLN